MKRFLRRYKYTTATVVIFGGLLTLATVYGHGSWRKAAIAGLIAGGLTLFRELLRKWKWWHD